MEIDKEDIAFIRDDIKSITSDMTEMRVWLAKNTESLEHHIKRTDLLQGKVEMMDEHVNFIKNLTKIIAIAGTVSTTLISLFFAYKGIGH